MKSLDHQSLLHGLMKYAVSVAIIACGALAAHCNSACGQVKASSGGGSAGSLIRPRDGSSSRSSALLLVLDATFKEGVSPGMSYACLQTARDTRFAYFCLFSEDIDEIPFSLTVCGERGEIKQSFKIADHDCPIIYSVSVNNQAKAAGDEETLRVNGVDLDLNHGRLLLIDKTGDAVVVQQAAIPPFNFPKNGLRTARDRAVSEEVEQMAARIVREVSQSLRDGRLKTRTVTDRE